MIARQSIAGIEALCESVVEGGLRELRDVACIQASPTGAMIPSPVYSLQLLRGHRRNFSAYRMVAGDISPLGVIFIPVLAFEVKSVNIASC